MTQNVDQKGTVAEQEKKKVINENILDRIGDDVYKTLGLSRVSLSGIPKDLNEIVGTRSRPAGYTVNSAMAFGLSLSNVSSTLNLLSNILKEINENNNPNSPLCKVKIPNDTPQKEENDLSLDFEDYVGICFQKNKLVAATKDGFSIETVFNLISELSKPSDPAECINPYFDQFFNLVPVQFILFKLLRNLVKNALAGLSDQEVQEIISDVQPCGSELTKIYNNNLDIPEISFPLFKIPALPTIPNIDLYTVLDKLIVEAVCFSICTVMTPLIVELSQLVNKFLKEFLTDENIGSGSYTEFLDNSLGKLNLNQKISDAVLNQAIIQQKVSNYQAQTKELIGPPKDPKTKVGRDGLWRQPTAEEQKKVLLENIVLIRQYFKAIFEYKVKAKKSVYNLKEKKYKEEDSFRELGTKELIFLMLGEFNCFTIQDLIEIGSRPEFAKLRLDNEQRIKTFFSFIGNDIDPIALVTDLKKEACPPDPCEEIEQEVVEKVQNKISEMCKILNAQKSGIPPISVIDILKSVGLQDLFNQGIKEQFNQLKTENLLFLGFPSLSNFPGTEDINPFLPKENVLLTDYDIWNNKIIQDEQIFKNYLLRGGPALKWKYDNVDLNKELKGATLEDVCGEEETFEQTFIHIFSDIFKIDYNTVQPSLESKKDVYKKQFEKKVLEIYADRTPTSDSELLALENKLKANNKGTLDDDEEGLVNDLMQLYKTYKKSYDKQKGSKDRIANWILGVRKDAGKNWNGPDVFSFVNSVMGYGDGYAQKVYNGLNADDYDF